MLEMEFGLISPSLPSYSHSRLTSYEDLRSGWCPCLRPSPSWKDDSPPNIVENNDNNVNGDDDSKESGI